MPSISVLVTQAPYGTVHAAEAVRHVNGALSNGFEAVLALVDDGVWLARKGQSAGATGYISLSGAISDSLGRPEGPVPRLLVHGPSLRARGLRPADLLEGAFIVDEDGFVEALSQSDHLLRF